MKNEEQRIAIGEFAGWKRREPKIDMAWGASATNNEWAFLHQLPDYLNDLNAMHEAEKLIHDSWWNQYVVNLAYLVRGQASGDSGHSRDYATEHASAPQRAEALLRTIGKWKD